MKKLLFIFVLVSFLTLVSCNKEKSTIYAPSIGSDKDNNIIWTSVNGATSYDIYVNGELYKNVTNNELEAFIQVGSYQIYVVAKDDLGNASEKSATISYTVSEKNYHISTLPSEFDYFKHNKLGSKIYIVDISLLSNDEVLLLESLQGILVNKGVSLYLKNENNNFNFSNFYTKVMTTSEMINYAKENSLVKGYIFTSQAKLNVAKTVCNYYESVIVTNSTLSFAQGLTLMFNADTDEISTAITESLNKNIVVTSNYYTDLGIANNCLFTTDVSIASSYDVVLGNGPAKFSLNGSEKNLSVLETIEILDEVSKGKVSTKTNTHYVTVISNESASYISNSRYINLLEANLAPVIMNGRDYYVSSDLLTNIKWNNLSNKEKSDYTALINIMMSNIGSEYLVLNKENKDALSNLAYMDSVKGGIIKGSKEITWLNNKPFVGCYESLTEENYKDLAAKVSNSSNDVNSIDSYTIIDGSKADKETLEKFYSSLNTNVTILRTDELMKTIQANVDKYNKEITLSNDISTIYLTPNHLEYDMFGIRYSSLSSSLYFLFTNSLSGFESRTSSNTSIGINNGVCVMNYSNGKDKNYMYQRITLPSWDSIYLNVDFQSFNRSECKLILYFPSLDRFVTLLDSTIYAKALENFSFDLCQLGFDVKGLEVAIIIDQACSPNTYKQLIVDNIAISKTKTREDVFDSKSLEINDSQTINLEDGIYTNGKTIYNDGLVLFASTKTVYDDALSNMSVKVRLPYNQNGSYSLSLNLTDVNNALYRVRVLDKTYINNLVLPWTYINGDTNVSFDISNYMGQDVIIYVELSNKDYTESSFKISSLVINKSNTKYYYQIGKKETFQGTSNVWNLEGWVLNDDCTYGDLTSESGYGSLRLDGSNGGVFNPDLVIAQANKSYHLTTNNTLSFYARSGGPTNSTYIRVRVLDENGTYHIVKTTNSIEEGWVLVNGEPWVKYSFNLSSFANQNVTIFIDQTDHGSGIGEIAFIDTLIIE